MPSSTLLSLFTTLAQVSFTVSGLMAVAIAGDEKRRDYWFGHEARSLFVYISFLLLLLPGFISIGGLIPSTRNVPFWVFTTLALGLLYSALAVTFYFKKRKLAEPEEFKRLEKRFSKVNTELGASGLGMIYVATAGGVWAYNSSLQDYGKAETWLGVLLFLAIISGALASVILLRANEVQNRQSNEVNATLVLERSSGNSGQDAKSSAYAVVSLLIAIIAFLTGIFLKSGDD